MKFCEKCNGIMIPIENGNMKCKHCSHISAGELISNEKIKEKAKKKEGIVEDKGNEFATHEHICKKCGYDKAQIIERPPYITDEDTLLYVKCGKCGFMENLSRKIM